MCFLVPLGNKLFPAVVERAHKRSLSGLEILSKNSKAYMNAHVGLQISCFDKGPIASDEGAVDGRPFFLARPDDFVVAEVEAET